MNRRTSRLAALLLGSVVALVLVTWAHPAYLHLFVGQGRVLTRTSAASVSWETADHPNAELYSARHNPQQLVLWVSSPQLPTGRAVILIDPSTWHLGIPNASTAQFARIRPFWLVQADSGLFGAPPGKAEWSPNLRVRSSEAAFDLPAFAAAPTARIVIRLTPAT
jgi:hypothetical protein